MDPRPPMFAQVGRPSPRGGSRRSTAMLLMITTMLMLATATFMVELFFAARAYREARPVEVMWMPDEAAEAATQVDAQIAEMNAASQAASSGSD